MSDVVLRFATRVLIRLWKRQARAYVRMGERHAVARDAAWARARWCQARATSLRKHADRVEWEDRKRFRDLPSTQEPPRDTAPQKRRRDA